MVEKFNYFFGKSYGATHLPKTAELIKKSFTEMKLNNFNSNSNYLRVNMNGSSFLQRDTSKDMEEYMCEDHAMYDE